MATPREFVDVVLQRLHRLQKNLVVDPSNPSRTERDLAIACAAIENALLAADSGVVNWEYIEHELTTVRLRAPDIIEHDALRHAIRVLFMREWPRDQVEIEP